MDFEGLDEQQASALIEELTLYALYKLRGKRLRGLVFGTSHEEFSPRDVVVEALVRHAEGGSRERNKERYPTLREQLRATIDSLISNHVRSAENQVLLLATERERPSADAPDRRAEARMRLERLWEFLVEWAMESDDELLFGALALLEEGKLMPSDYQAELGLSAPDAKNLRKRVRRALLAAESFLNGEGNE